MKVAARVLEEKNYKKFDLHPLNRDVTKTNALEKSMRTFGWLDAFPMYCVRNGSSRLLIKDGHHRFDVALMLGIPVKYVVGTGDGPKIQDLQESTVPWSLLDYLACYRADGREPYIRVSNYHAETGISLQSCVSLLAGEDASSHNQVKRFKQGSYITGDETHAGRVADIVLHMKKCGISWASIANLVGAISKILWLDEIDLQTLKHRISRHSYLIEKQPTVDAYIEMLEKLYCRHSSNKIPVKFLAEAAAKKRNPALQVKS